MHGMPRRVSFDAFGIHFKLFGRQLNLFNFLMVQYKYLYCKHLEKSHLTVLIKFVKSSIRLVYSTNFLEEIKNVQLHLDNKFIFQLVPALIFHYGSNFFKSNVCCFNIEAKFSAWHLYGRQLF